MQSWDETRGTQSSIEDEVIKAKKYLVNLEIDYLCNHIEEINSYRQNENMDLGRVSRKIIENLYGFHGRNIYQKSWKKTINNIVIQVGPPFYLSNQELWIPDILKSCSKLDLESHIGSRNDTAAIECRSKFLGADGWIWVHSAKDVVKSIAQKSGRPRVRRAAEVLFIEPPLIDQSFQNRLIDPKFQPPVTLSRSEEDDGKECANPSQILRTNSEHIHRFKNFPTNQGRKVKGIDILGNEIEFSWIDDNELIVVDTYEIWVSTCDIVKKSSQAHETLFLQCKRDIRSKYSDFNSDCCTKKQVESVVFCFSFDSQLVLAGCKSRYAPRHQGCRKSEA